MDFYRELDKIDKHVPLRQRQELEKMARKTDDRFYPYKNTCHKATGEHFPTLNEKIKVKKILS